MFGSATTSSRYSISRSMNERNRHLIFEEGGFDELPESIRRQTPWQYLKSGEFKIFVRIISRRSRTEAISSSSKQPGCFRRRLSLR